MEKEISNSKKNNNENNQIKNMKIIDINEIEGSTFKTKKKSFVSDINPHLVRRNIQKEQYIWFGVYDQLLRNKIMISYLKKCKDASLPLECAAIHLEKYQVSFCKSEVNSEETKIFLFENDGSLIFLKLYLITKEQLTDLIQIYYQIQLEGKSDIDIFKTLNKPDTQICLPSASDYSNLKCLGELDGILIYSMASSKSLSQLKVSAPDTDYLRNIFLGLKTSFSPYSEYLIMYYVYRLDGVRNNYPINQLQECFYKNKNNSSIETKNSTSGNKDLNLNVETIQNINTFNIVNTVNTVNNSPCNKGNDNETVKCSTCNASPFVTTPEKDHLNQYAYIFDLHYLPIFDENTGEFFWSNNEANWKKARDSILKSDELVGQTGKSSISINHGSLMSLSGSFLMGGSNNLNNINTINLNTNTNLNTTNNENKLTEEDNINTWTKFKNDGASNTFIEELNNLLKDFDK